MATEKPKTYETEQLNSRSLQRALDQQIVGPVVEEVRENINSFGILRPKSSADLDLKSLDNSRLEEIRKFASSPETADLETVNILLKFVTDRLENYAESTNFTEDDYSILSILKYILENNEKLLHRDSSMFEKFIDEQKGPRTFSNLDKYDQEIKELSSQLKPLISKSFLIKECQNFILFIRDEKQLELDFSKITDSHDSENLKLIQNCIENFRELKIDKWYKMGNPIFVNADYEWLQNHQNALKSEIEILLELEKITHENSPENIEIIKICISKISDLINSTWYEGEKITEELLSELLNTLLELANETIDLILSTPNYQKHNEINYDRIEKCLSLFQFISEQSEIPLPEDKYNQLEIIFSAIKKDLNTKVLILKKFISRGASLEQTSKNEKFLKETANTIVLYPIILDKIGLSELTSEQIYQAIKNNLGWK